MTTRLQNLYIARLTTQERPCFVCSKFTTVVLTLADNSNNDWFYTCRSHLGDFNFCSKIGGASPKPTTPSTSPRTSDLKDRPVESDSVVDLVSSIGSALTSWRKKPDDKDKDKDDKDDKDKDEEEKDKDTKKNEKGDNNNKGKDDDDTASSSTSRPSSPPLTSSPQPLAPPKFILQRDYFYLRQREYMKKQQKKEADEKLKTLQFPKVPTSLPSAKQ
ncbi:VPS4-associated protein 1 [Absidia repens]|uniref:VPS4-associated protein 1 n=1 Tax=Absidia repens TaxID=90262 RepID=A0A1X2IQX6_9FUNG|nr:VPS4-associated protein 1 [Absidia repens]